METAVVPAPLDAVAALRFAPTADLLAVASWDQSVRVYTADGARNRLGADFPHPSPVLDVCWATDTILLSGEADGSVHALQLEPQRHRRLGGHDDAVTAVAAAPASAALFTGSFDKTVKRWDPRVAGACASLKLPSPVLRMDCSGHRLVVAMTSRRVHIYDARFLNKPEQRRESGVLHQTRCVRCSPDGTSYALSSAEGRIAIESLDPDPGTIRTMTYAFKCYRQRGDDAVYPVDALAFYPRHGTFATGSADGYVHFWNALSKKRLFTLRKFPASVSALDFNSTGTLLAVASSHDGGHRGNPSAPSSSSETPPPHQVFIRTVTDTELAPRP